MKCPTCYQNKTNSLDKEAIKCLGECLSCDHQRSDFFGTFIDFYYETLTNKEDFNHEIP
jgi:hypothetical protein